MILKDTPLVDSIVPLLKSRNILFVQNMRVDQINIAEAFRGTGVDTKLIVLFFFFLFFTVVPCILIVSKSFIYQLMHNRVALKEY
jgi:hypothetical protein